MSYISQSMLEDRLNGAAELIRLTGGTSSVDASVLDRCVTDGEAVILANIRQRYTLPLALTDELTAQAVRKYLIDSIVYQLYLSCDRQVPEEIGVAYKAAVAWSEKVAAGTLGLVGEAAVGESPAPTGKIEIEGGTVTVTRESTKGL